MYRSRTKFNARSLEMRFSANVQLEYDQAMFLEIVLEICPGKKPLGSLCQAEDLTITQGLYNIDRTLRALCLIKNPRFIRV